MKQWTDLPNYFTLMNKSIYLKKNMTLFDKCRPIKYLLHLQWKKQTLVEYNKGTNVFFKKDFCQMFSQSVSLVYQKMKFLLFCSIFLACYAEKYVPGTPGASWSLQEMLVVKAKLYALFSEQGQSITSRDRKPGALYGFWLSFTERKALRLGFHDCLKYTDGSGGCDGCLNWKNVDSF